MKATRPSGLANWFLRKVMTAPLGPASSCCRPACLAQALDLDHVEQVLHLVGQLAEAVDQLGGEARRCRAAFSSVERRR